MIFAVSHTVVEYFRFSTAVILFAFTTLCMGAAAASDSDRILQLEATVRELTLQNARQLEEINRLSAAMKQALEAQRSGKQLVMGCDSSPLAEALVYENIKLTKLSILKKWLGVNASNCSKKQLQEIQNNFVVWGVDSFIRSDADTLINFLIKKQP